MKEIRITFAGEDFAAVTQHMIELGVRFRVEPLSDDEEADAGAPVPRRREARQQKPAKAGKRGPSSRPEPETAAAARLRAMAERNRAASGRPADDQRDPGGANGLPSATSPFEET